MHKIGIEVRIDVSKIDKARLYQGAKGNYLTLTTFVDLDNKDQYDNNGFICQASTKEERDSGLRMPILGNVKVFYGGPEEGSNQDAPAQNQTPQAQGNAGGGASFDDDIPF